MKEKLSLDDWGGDYLLRSGEEKIALLRCITKEKSYCVFAEREIKSYSGPPLTKFDLAEIGNYFNKVDLKRKFHNASLNYSKNIADKLKTKLIIAVGNNKPNLSEQEPTIHTEHDDCGPYDKD